MPYREKIAWLSLVGIAVCYGPYFALTHHSPLAVGRRASTVAYYVLIGCALYVGCFMPFITSGWHIVNAMVASVLIAEFLGGALIVTGYRRGLK